MKADVYIILKLVDRHKGIVSRGINKGIGITQDWRGSQGRENFIIWALNNNFSPELELDRINPSGIYEPSNCQFISSKENRVKDMRKHEYKGEFYTLKELHKHVKSKIKYGTVVQRILNGWNIIEALTIPSNKGNRWIRKATD